MATLEQRLREALELLKRSAGYASAYPSIGGHTLSTEIAEFRAQVLGELDRFARAPSLLQPNTCMACGTKHGGGGLPCPRMKPTASEQHHD